MSATDGASSPPPKRTRTESVAALPEAPATVAVDPPEAVVHCRNAGADRLAREHPLKGEGLLTFAEEGHKYTFVEGNAIERSCTSLIAPYFEEFNAQLCVSTYYHSWKKDPTKVYHEGIWRVLDGGGTNEDAQREICDAWTAEGEDASRLGTAFHKHAEFDCNDAPLAPHSELATEIAQYESFKRVLFGSKPGIAPFRTEMCVAYRLWSDACGAVVNVCAGQIDALYKDAAGNVYLVDFKRKKKKHALDARELGFRGRCGRPPLAHLADTQYQKISLQTSVYAVMLEQTCGIDVDVRMYVLRVHRDRERYQFVRCADLRNEARALLDIEYGRLVRKLSGREESEEAAA
jgi:hypothetical protein